MKSMVMTQVADHFRPEFINRIDEVVVFHPLGREQIRAIADIQIGYLRQRLLDRQMGSGTSPKRRWIGWVKRVSIRSTAPGLSSGRFNRNWKIHWRDGFWRASLARTIP
jgi:hypothetical protein